MAAQSTCTQAHISCWTLQVQAILFSDSSACPNIYVCHSNEAG